MKSIAFVTLGCKVNQADTASMETLFRQRGFIIKKAEEQADIYLVNTCVVTNMGQRKSRQMISRMHSLNPNALIVVTGCYVATAPEEVKALTGVGLVVAGKDRKNIVDLVEGKMLAEANNTAFDELPAGDVSDRTRAFLKIQEGCNQFCTYCIIPYARGPLRSRSLAGIAQQVGQLVGRGYKEIVLIGIHLGRFKNGDYTLKDAVKQALQVPKLERLRLGSLESVEVDEGLLELMFEDKRFCPHLHLPLQSGCNKILEAMHRPYDREKFAQLVQLIRSKVPNIAITTDVIVGFPGETEEDFQDTRNFVKQIGFAKMHIFPYSKRAGTPAATMPGQLTEKEKSRRAKILAEDDRVMQRQFMESMTGQRVQVLVENAYGDGYMQGYSENYQPVLVQGGDELTNKVVEVEIKGIKEGKNGLYLL